jgi:hypothetical protein
MRSILGLAASALAGVAAIAAVADGDGTITPFFIGLTFVAGLEAWAAQSPFAGRRRLIARVIALAWLVAAIWIGALLLMFGVACGCSGPPKPPPNLYLGLPGTVYHLLGLYGGLALILASAFGRGEWLEHAAAVHGA